MIIAAKGEPVLGLRIVGLPEVPVFCIQAGNDFVLVEGGVSATSGLVLAALRELIGSLERVSHWLITHLHYDHCGLLPFVLPALPNAQVVAPRGSAARFRNRKAQAVIQQLNHDVSAAWWHEHGPSSDQLRSALTWDAVAERTSEVAEQFSVNELAFDVLRTPGHSGDQLCYVESSRGWAFVSDALGEHYAGAEWCPLVFDNREAQERTLVELCKLPINVLCPGHHNVFTGADATRALRDAQRSHESLRDSVRNSDHGTEILAEFLTDRFFSRSQEFVSKELHLNSMRRMVERMRGGACDVSV